MLGSRGSITKTWILQVNILKVLLVFYLYWNCLNIFVTITFQHYYSTYLSRIFLIEGLIVICIYSFTSRADFRKEPAFSWMNKLSAEVKLAITRSKILFCNGYGFDELCPDLITSALDYSVEVGTSIFFDPGPRGKSLSKGTPEERRALRKILQMSDVLLLTSDEVQLFP